MRRVVATLSIFGDVALVLFTGLTALRTRQCPSCGRRQLRRVSLVGATIFVDGRRSPDCWSYHLCRACGATLKLHRGRWSAVEDGERHHFTETV
jgi:hypothetical protein